jgi:hypothetical protein
MERIIQPIDVLRILDIGISDENSQLFGFLKNFSDLEGQAWGARKLWACITQQAGMMGERLFDSSSKEDIICRVY